MNINSSYVGLLTEARILVEEHQTPLLCFYLDKETNEVKMIADSESKRKVKESEQFEKLVLLLKSTLKEKNKLTYFYDCTLRQFHEQNLTLLPITSYDKLPTEILRAIFKYLGPEDLKTLLLVSQTWKSVADEPLLWTGFGLPRKCTKNQVVFQRFFEGSLSLKLQYLELGKFDFKLDDYFERFMALNLASIKITKDVDLSSVSELLLATLLNKCKVCSISDAFLVPKKFGALLKVLFKKMCMGTKIKSLKLEQTELTSIPPDVLSEAFKSLTSIKLNFVAISSDQFKAILKNLRIDAEVKIKIDNDKGFDTECVISILDRLTGLSFYGEPLIEEQLRRWMDILDKSGKLKSLEMLDIGVSQIPAQLLSRVVNKIEMVKVRFFEGVSPHQLKEIFKGIVKSDSKIKHLELDCMNLRLINPELFAKAVNKLDSFYYGLCEVSECQVLEMFRIMSLGTNLKNLGTCCPESGYSLDKMEYIELVDPDTLAKAVNNLDSLQLDLGASFEDKSRLTLTQLLAIVKQLNSKTSLKNIWRWSRRAYITDPEDHEIVKL